MKRKWKLIFGVILALAAVIFMVTQGFGEIEVEVLEVKREVLRIDFTEEGEVKSKEERNVFAIHGGKLETVLVNEGDRVNEGDLIAVIDSESLSYQMRELMAQLKSLEGEEKSLIQTPGRAEIESHESAIRQAEEMVREREKHYSRIKQLYEHGFAPRVQLEEAETLLTEALYHLERQRLALTRLFESYEPAAGLREVIEGKRRAIISQLEFIEYQEGNHNIYAPISGVVANVQLHRGDMAHYQTPIMKILQPENYVIEVRLLTRDIPDIYPGMMVNLIFELRDTEVTFSGAVTEIAPYAEASLSPLGLEEERVKVTIDPEVPEELTLAPGYKMDVQFTTAEEKNQIVVPKSSLFTYQGEDSLWVIENDRAVIRTVITGMETRLSVAIKEGLNEGDLVILDPRTEDLQEGAAISYRIN